jgi:hypothetical protein
MLWALHPLQSRYAVCEAGGWVEQAAARTLFMAIVAHGTCCDGCACTQTSSEDAVKCILIPACRHSGVAQGHAEETARPYRLHACHFSLHLSLFMYIGPQD